MKPDCTCVDDSEFQVYSLYSWIYLRISTIKRIYITIKFETPNENRPLFWKVWMAQLIQIEIKICTWEMQNETDQRSSHPQMFWDQAFWDQFYQIISEKLTILCKHKNNHHLMMFNSFSQASFLWFKKKKSWGYPGLGEGNNWAKSTHTEAKILNKHIAGPILQLIQCKKKVCIHEM